jgi:hypothetical protein
VTSGGSPPEVVSYMITTKLGAAAFIVTWLLVAVGVARSGNCLSYSTCGAGDVFLAMIVGVVMLVPTYILGLVVDAMFGVWWQKVTSHGRADSRTVNREVEACRACRKDPQDPSVCRRGEVTRPHVYNRFR